MKRTIILGLFLLSSLPAVAEDFGAFTPMKKSKWNASNHPSIILGEEFESRFEALPLEASLEDQKKIWSDTYWPRYLGGIAMRWQTNTPTSKYSVLNRDQVHQLTQEEINLLSPSEKYDLLLGNYDFPFTKKVRRENPSSVEHWQGICHGWTQAAIHHSPAEVRTLKNDDGLEITFGVSDINALLSYHYAKVDDSGVKILAKRCSMFGVCRDMNAGSFHLVLTNMIGLRKESFAADISVETTVWNQPMQSYKSKIIKELPVSRGASDKAVKEVEIETQVQYISESPAHWEGLVKNIGRLLYSYRLELDAEGKIVGGHWLNEAQPDFLWIKPKATFRDEWAIINQLLPDSL